MIKNHILTNIRFAAKSKFFYILISCLIFFANGILFHGTQPVSANEEKIKPGVQYVKLRVPSGRVRETPCFDAEVAFGLTQGDIVPIIETKGKWYRIQIEDGRTGWAHRKIFSKIRIQQPEEAAPNPEKKFEIKVLKELEDIRVHFTKQGEEKVIFVLNGFYPPETFILEEDIPKIVCDFFEVKLGKKIKDRRRFEIDGQIISTIRIGVHEGEKPKSRIVLDLVSGKYYEAEPVFLTEENLYILMLKDSQETADIDILDEKYGF